MTRTTDQHEALLAPYRDPDTDRIDTRAFATAYNVDTISAMYGPDNGAPNNATYLVAREHNAIIGFETQGVPVKHRVIGAWLRAVVMGIVALAAGLLAR